MGFSESNRSDLEVPTKQLLLLTHLICPLNDKGDLLCPDLVYSVNLIFFRESSVMVPAKQKVPI